MNKTQRLSTIFLILIILLSASARFALAETGKVPSPESQTTELTIQVDFSMSAGVLKPLHGVNGGPRTVGRHSGDMVILHKQAGFPSVRLHDCNWPHPDVVDIPAIFPLFHLDADDPKNYQFAKTDAYIKPIIENRTSILYRMGVSIEHKEPRFHVAPPEDFEKWSKICVNILRHYNDGWADGFHYNIRHVEIWNETASKLMWTGTTEQYCELYKTTVTAIKKYNPEIKVGGPVSSAIKSPEVRPFLAYCRDNKVPLDFFSWHSYSNESMVPLLERIGAARNLLDEYGFKDTENWCTEWKFIVTGWERLRWRKDAPRHMVRDAHAECRNHEAAALTASALLEMQDTPIDQAYYYCADDSPWSMFDEFGEPGHAYFAMKAFNQFLQVPERVAVTGAPGKDEITVGAGLSKNGKQAMLMTSNFRSKIRRLRVDLKNLPWKSKVNVTAWRIDDKHEFSPEEAKQIAPDNPVLTLDLPAGTVLLVQLQPEAPVKDKFIDMHVHAFDCRENGLDIVEKWMKENNVDRCVILPLAQSRPQNDQQHKQMLDNYSRYKGRIDRYCVIFPDEVSTKEQAVKILTEEKQQGAIGFGEHYGRGIYFDDPQNMRLYAACREVKLPVLFHMDKNCNLDEKGLPHMENALKAYPNCTFIAHSGWWKNLADGTCERLLQKYPNLYADLSAGVCLTNLNRNREYTRSFLIRNADKIMFGTDCGWWSFSKEPVQHFTLFDGFDLPDEVKAKIYRKNAERVFALSQ